MAMEGGSSTNIPTREAIGVVAPIPCAGAASVPAPPDARDDEKRLNREVQTETKRVDQNPHLNIPPLLSVSSITTPIP